MKRVTIFTLALAALVLASPASAKKPAKVTIQVVDEGGEPVPGVLLTITAPDDPNFRAEVSGNKKGVLSFELGNPSGNYIYRFEKEGFETQIDTIQIQGKRAELQVVLPSANSPAVKRRRAAEFYNQGVEAFNAGDKAGAGKLFQQALDADDSLVEARVGQAEVALSLNDLETAVSAAEQALSATPESLPARRILFEGALALGDDQRTASALENLRGTELAEGAAVLLYNDGVALMQNSDLARAGTRFQQAVRLDPSLALAHAALASAHFNQQDFESSLATVDNLLALEPENALGLRLRYRAAEALGDEDLAAEALAALEAVAPESAAELLYSRAEAAFKANDLEAAKPLLNKILAVSPDHVEANFTLGLCYLNGGDTAQARAQLQKVIDLAPDSQQARDAKEMLQFVN